MIWIDYDRQTAAAYAHRWAYGRNPAYYNYDEIGGDCTNFASQCIYAGGGVMNGTPTFGWYYWSANNKAPAWTGVEYLARFMLQTKRRLGPVAELTPLDQIEVGDVVQLSFDGQRFAHSPVVVGIEGETPTLDTVLVAAHSQDADNRPLSTYPVVALRCLHILGSWG